MKKLTTQEQILEKIQVDPIDGLTYTYPDVNKLASYLYSLQEKKEEKCDFEGDGYKHQCYACEIGQVENCKKCHRDRCNNPECKNSKEYNDKECQSYAGCICNDPLRKNETCKACMAGFKRGASYIAAGGGKVVEPKSKCGCNCMWCEKGDHKRCGFDCEYVDGIEPTPPEWEKDYSDKFGQHGGSWLYESIKDFISSLLMEKDIKILALENTIKLISNK